MVRLQSRAHYDACDFTGAVTLAPQGADGIEQSYYYECATPGSDFLSCSIAGHCAAGQKLEVNTSSTESVFDANGETLLHAKSLRQVMTLLGAPQMDRGYQTELQANHTLEVIWCLESHAPDSCKDWQGDSTVASCKADVHNLAGFVSRKRPLPDYSAARTYYDEALGFDVNHCPTLQYLTELYLQVGNTSGAIDTAERLCTACDAASRYAAETRTAFETRSIDGESVNAPAACFAPPSAPPGLPPPQLPPPYAVPGAAIGAAIGGGIAVVLAIVATAAVVRRRRGASTNGKKASGKKANGKKASGGGDSFGSVVMESSTKTVDETPASSVETA